MCATEKQHCLLNKNNVRLGKLTQIGTMEDSMSDLKLGFHLKTHIGKESTYRTSFSHNMLKSLLW